MLLSLVLAVALTVLAVFFADQNPAIVSVQMYGLHATAKLGIVVVIAFGLGALVGMIVILPAYVSQGWALLRSRRRAEDLENSFRSNQPGGLKQV